MTFSIKTAFTVALISVVLAAAIISVYAFTNGQNAALVIGQSSFTTGTAALTQSGLTSADGALSVVFDSSGNLWVADGGHGRVLEFTPPFSNGMSASAVIGQSSFTTGTAALTQSGLTFPFSVVFDSSGNLWVADNGNNRVLKFAAPTPVGGILEPLAVSGGVTVKVDYVPIIAALGLMFAASLLVRFVRRMQ